LTDPPSLSRSVSPQTTTPRSPRHSSRASPPSGRCGRLPPSGPSGSAVHDRARQAAQAAGQPNRGLEWPVVELERVEAVAVDALAALPGLVGCCCHVEGEQPDRAS
jgi:hypothetical protein